MVKIDIPNRVPNDEIKEDDSLKMENDALMEAASGVAALVIQEAFENGVPIIFCGLEGGPLIIKKTSSNNKQSDELK